MSSIEEKLEVARRELLDLGLRNPLINYRPLRARGVEVIDERPVEVFRILVHANRAMYFIPRPEEKKERVDSAEEPTPIATADTDWLTVHSASPTGVDAPSLSHLDLKLQTPYTAAELEKRLLNTYYTARTNIEEQGVNVLYLALGMLRWYEAANSDVVRLAPLILVPVRLDRTDVYTRFRLRYTEEEIGENASLRAKLRVEFGVDLPPFPDPDDFNIPAYLEAVQYAIQPLARWSVDNHAIALGFFSFAAFLMFNDLQAANWPAGSQPAEHPVLQALLRGHFNEPPSPFDGDAPLDPYLLPPQSHQVVDADSSQTAALLDVAQGRNLVIQGPPGTGKSQTITNLIAEAIAQNKTVLFVAEKMAALEVVKRRLDQVGIGDACLELHSHKTNKKSVLQELRRTLSLGRPQSNLAGFDSQLLAATQQALNRTNAALHTPVGRSGITPYQLYGELLHLAEKLQGVTTPNLTIAGVESWTAADFQRCAEQAAELQGLLARMGLPSQHPFWGSRRQTYLPADERQLQQNCQAAQDALLALQQAGLTLATHLGLPQPASRAAVEQTRFAALRVLKAPPLAGIEIANDAWATQGPALLAAVQAGARLAELHHQYQGRLIPEAWSQNVLPIREALMAHGRHWLRWLSGPYRQARRQLAGLLNGDLPPALDDQLALVEAILESQRLRPLLAAHEADLPRLYGHHWRGQDSDWSHLTAVAEWLVETHRLIQAGYIPAALLTFVSHPFDWKAVRVLAGNVDQQLAAHAETTAAVVALLQLDQTVRPSPAALPFTEQLQLLRVWQTESGRLQEMVAWNHLVNGLNAAGLTALVAVAAYWPAGKDHLAALARRAAYEGLLAAAMQQRPELAAFDGQVQQRRVQTFRELDMKLFQANRLHLSDSHWQRLPRHTAGGQLGILQREFEKKSRHLPIRQLMERAGNAIQAIKPVFMMSPLSIAMFLPPGALRFDLVIFDEASQVQPVEAFGAILRGRQVVVVGDSRQLPPTTFFTRLLQTEEDEDSATADMESILGLFSAQGAPQRRLRWHYRSKHESLIAVSNQAFYENDLVVFPSPDAARQEVGLVYRYVPGHYQRGGDRTNPGEADAVAAAVMAHARHCPDQTLGVAAFSVGQMQAILDRVEALRRRDPTCEAFFNGHPEEPFFVKNLENVQGDERDVIFISIGYGRAADGSLALNFGPLNLAGGERRLNVLITRARRRCEVFTNLAPEDIDLSRTNAAGVIALKQFLTYAKTGRLETPSPSGRQSPFDAPFEQAVAAALRRHGYQVEQRVGSAGFFVDLAVVDESQPGRYLLAIDCDGPDRHRTARDRDRLRHQVLAGLGWPVYRLWSTEWFQSPERALQKLLEVIQVTRARQQQQAPPPNPPAANLAPLERQPAAPTQPPDLSLPPYEMASLLIRLAGRSLMDVSPNQLAVWIEQVVQVESPVHQEEVVRRIARAAGLQRVIPGVKRAIENGITHAVQMKLIQRHGRFLWKDGTFSLDTARSRAALPANARRLELIAPEEIAAAIRHLVTGAIGIQPEEIPPAVIRLFGFGRLNAESKAQVEQIMTQMVAAGELVRQGEFLVINNA